MVNQRQREDEGPPPDTGLRRMLTYTFIALVLSLLLALLAVTLVIRLFDRG